VVRVAETGELVAVVPVYLKTNSYGEYVFDWSWANAYQGNGLSYYPKLLTAVPFTPSEGSRILLNDPTLLNSVAEGLVQALEAEAQRVDASSYHLLFPNPAERAAFASTKMVERMGSQFHWHNRDYKDFDAFLATMTSRKRKSIRKEREATAAAGFRFRRTEGAAISPQQWADFSLFYHRTYLVRGQQGYLSQPFFERLGETMPEQILLIEALRPPSLDGGKAADEVCAAALFFKNHSQLFGRYWGSTSDQPLLHFETCYYQGQDYCIEHGLRSFDSGAQGEHKIQRGFEPKSTYSLHWLAHEGFAAAVANFVEQERPHIENYIADAATLLPFRQS
jgi:predicted N-acyltransferase